MNREFNSQNEEQQRAMMEQRQQEEAMRVTILDKILTNGARERCI